MYLYLVFLCILNVISKRDLYFKSVIILSSQNYTASNLVNSYGKGYRMGRAITLMIRGTRLNNICTEFYFYSFKFD